MTETRVKDPQHMWLVSKPFQLRHRQLGPSSKDDVPETWAFDESLLPVMYI